MKKPIRVETIDVVFANACFCISLINAGKEPPVVFRTERDARYHTHLTYELHYVIEGEGTIILEDRSILLRAGEALLLPPSLAHKPIILSENAKNLAFPFSLKKAAGKGDFYTYFQAMLDSVTESPAAFRVPAEFLPSADFLFRFSGYTKPRDFCYAQTEASRMMTILLDSMDRIYNREAVNVEAKRNQSLATLLDIMIDDYSYSKEQIAEALGYSPRNLDRIIQRHYGKSFREIRNEQKLQNVIWYIREGKGLCVTELARLSGFSSARVMRGVFFRKYGCTVEEYMEKERTEDH